MSSWFKTNYSRNHKNNTILKYMTVINDCVFWDEIMLSSFQVFSVILVVDFSEWSDKTLCKQTAEMKFAKWDYSILENGKNGLVPTFSM